LLDRLFAAGPLRRFRFAGNPPNDADPVLGLGFDGRGAL
jgi:hypothetical protein